MNNDKLGIAGHVEVRLFKAGQDPERDEGKLIVDQRNDIHSELKNIIAESFQSAKDFNMEEGGLFTSDTFTAPTVGKSGIYVRVGSNNYDCVTTEETPASSKNYKYKGIIRASATRVVTNGYMGYKYAGNQSSGSFTVDHASTNFGGNITLANGDQLTINWSITLS